MVLHFGELPLHLDHLVGQWSFRLLHLPHVRVHASQETRHLVLGLCRDSSWHGLYGGPEFGHARHRPGAAGARGRLAGNDPVGHPGGIFRSLLAMALASRHHEEPHGVIAVSAQVVGCVRRLPKEGAAPRRST